MSQVHGTCDPRFSTLRPLLQSQLDSNLELGASLAVEIDGQLVVDLWAGHTTPSKTTPWTRDTIVNVWSTTKNISSLALLLLVDRGLVDLDENVAVYWPEFAANGKGEVKVRQIMSHTSGVPAWEKPVELEVLYDGVGAAGRLAGQAPWWEPGREVGYHAMTHGSLIGEVVRRVTGRSLGVFIAEELAEPLGADFRLGVPEGEYGRVTDILGPRESMKGPPPPPGSLMEKHVDAPAMVPETANTKGWRNAEIGGGNGHGNGRSIARILSPLALGGTVDGRKYLSAGTIGRIFEEQAHQMDVVLGIRQCIGIGFGLPAKDCYWDWVPDDGRICGWGGWGGSMGLVDVGRRMTIGYAMNQMHAVGMGSVCTKAYVAEIYRILGVEI